MKNDELTLNQDDPRVIAARNAERALFAHYGIEANELFITLPNPQLKIRILEIGQGEPLVFVPGNTGDAYILAALFAHFTGRKIVAINRPGGGLSEGIDHTQVDIRAFAHQSLNTTFEALHLKNVDVVAHSMGAHWSTLLALEHPDKVKRLVLLGNPGRIMGGNAPLPFRLLALPLFTNFMKRVLIPRKKEDALRRLRMMGHSKELLARLPAELGEASYRFAHLPHYGLSATSLFQNSIPEIGAEELGRLHQPTALILGTKDNFVSHENGRKMVRAMKNGTFYSVQDAGHLPWLEDPREVARTIEAFLAR